MQLHDHYAEYNQDGFKQSVAVLREEIRAVEIVRKAPQHRRDKEKNKQGMPALPGTAAQSRQQQGHIGGGGEQREKRINRHIWGLSPQISSLSSINQSN